MQILFVVGRVLLVLIFIVSGAEKLLDIAGTAQEIGGYVTVPDALAAYATQLQQATGMTVPQLLAVLIGMIELVAGLLMAFNIATRGSAIVLVIYMLLVIFYTDNFWSTAGAARAGNLIDALKNLSIVGGLLILVVLGSWRPMAASKQM
jgi:putative oxidoreductase